MGKIIVLDPGHGGSDPGAVNGKRYETHDVLKLCKEVKKLLEKQGHTALLTREEDCFLALASRAPVANKAKADAFVSLHRNAFTGTTANGVEVYHHPSAPAADRTLASEVLEQVATVGVQTNRGVKSYNFQVLRDCNAGIPAILLELGFITNERDNQLFDRHFEDYARAIAKGILAYLGEPYTEDTGEPTPTYYRVQVGAFQSLENCQKYLRQVQELGVPAYIVYPNEGVDGVPRE